jgi:hypothetical protein
LFGRSRAAGRVIDRVVAPPSITDLESFVFSHGMSSWRAGRA